MEPGDVVVFLQEENSHPMFRRNGNDLFAKFEIGLTEALCGVSVAIEHLDGRRIVLKNPPGSVIQPGWTYTFFLKVFN